MTVWTFGPGIGELVVVHVPPDGWLVVDGCGIAPTHRSYARDFFELVHAAPTHVVMTHPHEDHYKGLIELIDEYTGKRPKNEWPILGALVPPRQGMKSLTDLQGYNGSGAAGHVLQAMAIRWRRHTGLPLEIERR